MGNPETGLRVIVERRTEFTAGGDEEQARKAAVQKTSNLLFAWRSRLTDDALLRPQQYAGGLITIHSPSPDYLDVVVAGDEKITRYNFNGETGDVAMQNLPAYDGAPDPTDPIPDDLTVHAQLSRILFDCDRIEVRG